MTSLQSLHTTGWESTSTEVTQARKAIQERQANKTSKQTSMAKSGKGLLLIVLLGLASPALAGFRLLNSCHDREIMNDGGDVN